jgi:hypothetical protein
MSNTTIKFRSACIKTLTAVEAHPEASNQHEFNGVQQLKTMFGSDRLKLNASFSIRGSDECFEAEMTWYDARERHPTRSEYRLYFQTNPVMSHASEGDNIVIGFDGDGRVRCELISNNASDSNIISSWQKVTTI